MEDKDTQLAGSLVKCCLTLDQVRIYGAMLISSTVTRCLCRKILFLLYISGRKILFILYISLVSKCLHSFNAFC